MYLRVVVTIGFPELEHLVPKKGSITYKEFPRLKLDLVQWKLLFFWKNDEKKFYCLFGKNKVSFLEATHLKCTVHFSKI